MAAEGLAKKSTNGTSLVLQEENALPLISVIVPIYQAETYLERCLESICSQTYRNLQIFLGSQEITAKGCDISQVRRKMGMVFQSFNLFGHLTVIENVMYAPIRLLAMNRQDAYDKAVKLLRMVGMEEKQMNYPDQLSGGQKQRVAIARTLAMDPEIILFDEPTSALDPTMIGEVQAVIRELARQKKTMMIVTHEMQFARDISNRVFYLDEGVIYEEGSPEMIFDHPAREKTVRFIKRLKVLEIDISSISFDYAGAISQIDQYCRKNQIHPRTNFRLQSAVEELCIQILMPKLEQPHIHVTITYEQEKEKAEVTVIYPGTFRPEDTDNTLAYTLLKANAESIEYKPGPDRTNSTVHIVFSSNR